jgi:hypothetical protein
MKKLLLILLLPLLFSCKKESVTPTQPTPVVVTYSVSIQHSGVYTAYVNSQNVGTPSNLTIHPGDLLQVSSMVSFSSQTMRIYIDNVMDYENYGTNLYYEKQF